MPKRGSLQSRISRLLPSLALLPALILGVSLQWDKVSYKNTVAPSTRSHHTSIFTENSVMVTFGGYDGAQYKNDVWIFNLKTHTWVEMLTTGDMPSAREFHAAIYFNSTMVVFGGYDGSSRNDLYVLDITTRRWKEKVLTNKPAPRVSTSSVRNNDKMVIIGGYTYNSGSHSYANDIWELDLVAFEWRQVVVTGVKPSARSEHSSVYWDGKIILFGGTDGNVYKNDLWAFDFTSSKWDEIQPSNGKPGRRSGHTSILYYNQMAIFGGYDQNMHKNDTWILKMPDFTWNQIQTEQNALTPRKFHTAIYYNMFMVIFAGNHKNKYKNDMFVLDLNLPWDCEPASNSGKYYLSSNCSIGNNSHISVVSELEISGTSSLMPVITAAAGHRHFLLDGTGKVLTLRYLQLVGGNAGEAEGGSIFVANKAKLNVFSCVIKENRARNGGAITSKFQNIINIYNSTIANNFGSAQYGGLFFFQGEANITYSHILYNKCGERHTGGLACRHCRLHLYGTNIAHNSALVAAGGIFIKGDDANGGSVVNITRCVIQNNSIRISKDGMIENWYYGAGMYVEKKASVTIRETSMLLNFANTQAGNEIYTYSSSSSPQLTLVNTYFANPNSINNFYAHGIATWQTCISKPCYVKPFTGNCTAVNASNVKLGSICNYNKQALDCGNNYFEPTVSLKNMTPPIIPPQSACKFIPCNLGQYLNAVKTRCLPCPRGKFSDKKYDPCQTCSSNTYTSNMSSTNCTSCPRGKYTRTRTNIANYKFRQSVNDCIEPPMIKSISPNVSSIFGNSSSIIEGRNFGDNLSEILFGVVAKQLNTINAWTDVKFSSDSEVLAMSSSGYGQNLDAVMIVDGISSKLSNEPMCTFSYADPIIDEIVALPLQGGTMEIRGAYFVKEFLHFTQAFIIDDACEFPCKNLQIFSTSKIQCKYNGIGVPNRCTNKKLVIRATIRNNILRESNAVRLCYGDDDRTQALNTVLVKRINDTRLYVKWENVVSNDTDVTVHYDVKYSYKKTFGSEFYKVSKLLQPEYFINAEVPLHEKVIYVSVRFVSIRLSDDFTVESPWSIPNERWTTSTSDSCDYENEYLDTICDYPLGNIGSDNYCKKWSCKPCPTGASCSGSVQWRQVKAKFGYWRLNPNFHELSNFTECIFPPACLGAPNLNFRGKFVNETGYDPSLIDSDEKCAVNIGYKDTCSGDGAPRCRLCFTCAVGYRRNNQNSMSRCNICPAKTANILLIFLGISVVALLLYLLLKMHLRSGGKRTKAEMYQIIIINYLQISSLAAEMDVPWPNELTAIFNFQGAISTIEMRAADSVYSKQIAYLLLPLFCIMLSFSLWLLYSKYQGRVFAYRGIDDRTPSLFDGSVATTVFLLYLLYPTLCYSSFVLLACRTIGNKTYLIADLQEPCYEGRHLIMLFCICIPKILLLVIGLPLCAFLKIRKHSKAMRLQHSIVQFRYGMLYSGYRFDRWWWDIVIAFRKAFIALIARSLNGTLQVHAILALLTLTIFLNILGNPYTDPEALDKGAQGNKLLLLDTTANFVTFLCAWSGLFFILYPRCEYNDIGCASIVLIVLLLNVLFLLFCAYLMANQKYREHKIEVIDFLKQNSWISRFACKCLEIKERPGERQRSFTRSAKVRESSSNNPLKYRKSFVGTHTVVNPMFEMSNQSARNLAGTPVRMRLEAELKLMRSARIMNRNKLRSKSETSGKTENIENTMV